MNTKTIMIAGVGGQGTLLASKLLGQLLLDQGYDVKISEVHGMSQRGGSVVTFVKFGEQVDSPVIELGEADVALSFELLEAARCLPYLKENGLLITNTATIAPMPVITGAMEYPDDLLESLETYPIRVESCDALLLAEDAGAVKAVNVVLLGVLARHLDFSREDWENAIRTSVPARFLESNLTAFGLTYEG